MVITSNHILMYEYLKKCIGQTIELKFNNKTFTEKVLAVTKNSIGIESKRQEGRNRFTIWLPLESVEVINIV